MSEVRLDRSIDAVNPLLHAWTGNGLLADSMAAAQWAGQVDRALQEWTLLWLAGGVVTRAPVLWPPIRAARPRRRRVAPSFDGLVLDLRGGEHTDTVIVAGRVWIWSGFDAASGAASSAAWSIAWPDLQRETGAHALLRGPARDRRGRVAAR